MAKKSKMTKKISIDLSDAQCLAIGKEQAEKELLYAKVENQKKESAAEFAGRLTKLWTEIQELAQQQKDKKRMEEIEVVEIPDLVRNKIKIVRADDERQIVETRDMTLNEMAEARQRDAAARQVSIPMDGDQVEANGDQTIVKLERGKKGKKSQNVPDTTEEQEPDFDA